MVLIFILLPGYLASLRLFKYKEAFSNLIIGSTFILTLVIPLHALLSKFDLQFVLIILITILNLVLFFFPNFKNKFDKKLTFNLELLIQILLGILALILIARQSLHVPSINLDQFLIWPDTYNALAQASEITNHGPSIFPFVADASVPLKYHWGAFSLGSFISLFGNFELIVVMFKTQFILLSLLFFSLLYITGKELGKSWYAGIFSVVLGGLTIIPNFPELNEQIGLARPFISSNSMPQFTANLFAIFGIYLVYILKNKINLWLFSILIVFTTLTATLSKGPVGLLILILAITYTIFNFKNKFKNNTIYMFFPSLIGFLVGYFQITSRSTVSGESGTSLWFNPKDTLNLLTESYGITLDLKSISIFLVLFALSFSSILFAFIYSWNLKSLNIYLPLIVVSFAGISGTLALEAWGNSQLFLLYSVIPFIAVLLSSLIFSNSKKLNSNALFFILLGFIGQAIIFGLLSSFVPRSNVLRTFFIWIVSTFVILLISIIYSRISKEGLVFGLLVTTSSIGIFSGLNKFDPIAYSLPEHPYSITIGTYEIGKYLRDNSDINDLLATNRHCAGIEENQTCTARQFALTAISERRVFLEGWSYTTCSLSDPILNSYWRSDSWKSNQVFFLNPNEQTWNLFKDSGVKWLVVDTTRPSSSSYSDFAELVKTSGQVQLWKVSNPVDIKISPKTDACSTKTSS